jgi:hypothetical protein
MLDKLSTRQQSQKAAKEERKRMKPEQKKDWIMAQHAAYLDNDREANYGDPSSRVSTQETMTKADHKLRKLNERFDEKLVGASQREIAKIEEERRKK